tara:strand:+ start:148873 stop:149010 length:138 start_codon:yes stop_codon:yes gene_type:complete
VCPGSPCVAPGAGYRWLPACDWRRRTPAGTCQRGYCGPGWRSGYH